MAWNPFKRHQAAPAPQTSVLPADVSADIENCTMVVRTSLVGDETNGVERVLIMMPGRRWYVENAEQGVRERWPDLNNAQVRRAVNWLQSKAHDRLRTSHSSIGRPTERWADWKPYSTEIDYR